MIALDLNLPYRKERVVRTTVTRRVDATYLQQSIAQMLNRYEPSLDARPDEIVIDERGASLVRVEEEQ